MSTSSVRFRPRQGGKDREHSSAERTQQILNDWTKRVQNVFSHYTLHLVIITVAVLVFSVGHQFKFPLEYEFPTHATPTTAPSCPVPLEIAWAQPQP